MSWIDEHDATGVYFEPLGLVAPVSARHLPTRVRGYLVFLALNDSGLLLFLYDYVGWLVGWLVHGRFQGGIRRGSATNKQASGRVCAQQCALGSCLVPVPVLAMKNDIAPQTSTNKMKKKKKKRLWGRSSVYRGGVLCWVSKRNTTGKLDGAGWLFLGVLSGVTGGILRLVSCAISLYYILLLLCSTIDKRRLEDSQEDGCCCMCLDRFFAPAFRGMRKLGGSRRRQGGKRDF